MAFDRNVIDKQRELNNLPPMTDAEFAALSGETLSDADNQAKLKQEADAAKLLADQEAETLRLAEEERLKNTPKPVVQELTEEQLLKLVAEKTGRTVVSWDDLKPKAEEADKIKAKEEREHDKFAWGFQSKHLKKEEYEGYVADSKDPKDLVYRQRLQAALKEDKDLDEKEFKEEFDDEFGLDAKEDSRRFKNGQDTLKRLANDILKSSYGSIYDLDNKYSQYENEQNSIKERKQKIEAGAPAYKKSLDTIKGKLKKIKTTIKEGEEYEVEVMDEAIDKVIDLMSEPDWAASQILRGATEEELHDVAWTAFLKQNHSYLTQKMIDQALLKKAAGAKGILTIDNNNNDGDGYVLNEAQQVLKKLNEQHAQPAVAN